MENRNGLIAAAMVTHADGYAERDAALLMLEQKQEGRSRRITVGADKAYDTKDFVRTVRELNVTPHVTKNDKGRSSNLDRRTTRQPGYLLALEGDTSVSILNGSGECNQAHDSCVTTASDGTFTITGDYTCPSPASPVNLYARSGNAGSGTNSGIGLLAAVGTCPADGTLSSSLYVEINEVSTIATAYALAGYIQPASSEPPPLNSSGSTLAQTGIANAFATVPNLETLGTGEALATTPAGNGTVPQSEINTLANILAAFLMAMV